MNRMDSEREISLLMNTRSRQSQIGIEVSRVAARKIIAHIGLGEVRQRRESDSGFEMVSEQNRISLSERYSSKIVFFRFVAQNLK